MKQQEYLNLKRKIENNFTKVQANVLLDIVNRIRMQDEIIAADRRIMTLTKENLDLKLSILAHRIKNTGLNIDISTFELPEEEAKKEDE